MKVFCLRFMFLLCLAFTSDFALADDPPKGGDKGGETAEQKLAAALKREEEKDAEIARLKAKGKKKKTEDEDDDSDDEETDEEDEDDKPDLRKKAKKQKDDAEAASLQTKNIERALGFNMSIDDFVTKNASLLPASITQIVKLAHKETYDSAYAKASALKAAIVQEYFSVQANLDALTQSQRSTLDDYLKLTKTGKEQKAADIYENIFEPALETIRKVKKAEEVGRGRTGFANPSQGDTSYKDKLVRQARKTHLGEKEA